MAEQTRYLGDESDHMKREQGTVESKGDLEATSSLSLGTFGVFCAMTPCIVYRRWHVRAVLWRAVWEIDELAKDCSSTEVTEERGLINDHRLARKRSGRRLGNNGQECSVFHVFGAPKRNKRLWSCHGRTHTHTHTHTAEKVVPSNMCSVVGRNGWSGGHRVHRSSLVLGSWRGGDRTTLQTA